MSKLIENSLEALKSSEFIFVTPSTLEVRNAVMIWTNFEGKANRFGNTTKNFNLVINEELKAALEADPNKVFNIHHIGGEGTEDPDMYFINVKINMDSAYPPVVTLYTDFRGVKSHVALDDASIQCLDHVNIQSADCVLNLYESKMHQGHVSAYLRKLNVIQNKESAFGGKYDAWEDDPVVPVNPELAQANADLAALDGPLPFGEDEDK